MSKKGDVPVLNRPGFHACSDVPRVWWGLGFGVGHAVLAWCIFSYSMGVSIPMEL